MRRKSLLASNFDQTLSFNDSGVVQCELIGFRNFHDKIKGSAEINLVQQGAELSYLILHDPDFCRVLREHSWRPAGEFGRSMMSRCWHARWTILAKGSAAPQEIIQPALGGIVPPDHIFGTRFQYNEVTGEHSGIRGLGQDHRA